MIKSLWASIESNPTLFKRVNGWLTILWMLSIPVCYVTGLLSSVVFVSILSLYAIVTGHLSAWQASRVEVKQEEEAEVRDDEAPLRIEEKVDELREKL